MNATSKSPYCCFMLCFLSPHTHVADNGKGVVSTFCRVRVCCSIIFWLRSIHTILVYECVCVSAEWTTRLKIQFINFILLRLFRRPKSRCILFSLQQILVIEDHELTPTCKQQQQKPRKLGHSKIASQFVTTLSTQTHSIRIEFVRIKQKSRSIIGDGCAASI